MRLTWRSQASGKPGGYRLLETHLSDGVQQKLAGVVFKECLKNMRNIPDEPRVIVIYSPHGKESLNFIKKQVDHYIENHSGTMVLIFNTYFDETPDLRVNVTHSKWGNALEKFARGQFQLLTAPRSEEEPNNYSVNT